MRICNKELADFLNNNYGMFQEKIRQVMGISLEVRKKMWYNTIGKTLEAKEEEEWKWDKPERDKAAIKEVMRKVCEEEEKKTREEVGKKICEGQSKWLEEIHANMPRDLAMAKFRMLKKLSIAKRGQNRKESARKNGEKRLAKVGGGYVIGTDVGEGRLEWTR